MRSGLDRWVRSGPSVAGLGPGARIGLLAHPSSIDARVRHAVELLHGSSDVRLKRLFAPEHGLWGHEQDMEQVGDAVEPFTGLPVVSLYGSRADSLRPPAEALAGLDAIVCDLQDVGSRYYTYVYTLSYVMEAARDAGVPVVVLDRPNPIAGVQVEGPVLDPALSSFVGRYPLPARHGMTVGELARLFNEPLGIGCDLRVVELEGWHRGMRFEDTGLAWVPPSPNMPTTTTALVYPGGCLIEGTNLSEGRGTTTPFELVGAPWLDARALAADMASLELPGVRFRAASFRPMFQKHAGRPCCGVQVLVDDAEGFRPFATYLALIAAIRRRAPEAFAWRTEAYEFETRRLAIDLLLGRPEIRPALERGDAVEAIEARWRDGLEGFLRQRAAVLLYE